MEYKEFKTSKLWPETIKKLKFLAGVHTVSMAEMADILFSEKMVELGYAEKLQNLNEAFGRIEDVINNNLHDVEVIE